MAFLDNSGDIILDAVLTDLGRKRLAEGTGRFDIRKFSLADDEINYNLFKNANHVDGADSRGSAYYDLDILQTPVLESFTNNTSVMKHKLIIIPNQDLLYLPIMKLNEETNLTKRSTGTPGNAVFQDRFVILVNQLSARNEDKSKLADTSQNQGLYKDQAGMIDGVTGKGVTIRVDQGLDSEDIDPSTSITEFGVRENQWKIEIDDRFGKIAPPTEGGLPVDWQFLDDDNVAHYYFTEGDAVGGSFVTNNNVTAKKGDADETIAGPRGTMLQFKILSTQDLRTGDTLFSKFGVTSQTWTRSTTVTGTASTTVKYIDTVIRISGQTTGYRIDIPVVFVKIIS